MQAAVQIRGQVLLQEPMLQHTSWRVGGPADQMLIPSDREDFIQCLQQLPLNEPIYIVGLGSNLLVRDGGLRGTVIQLREALNNISIVQQNADSTTTTLIYAEAGVTCAQLARFTVQQGLGGGEFFAGIPGTVGGALAMNAGAFGHETWSLVRKVDVIDRQGQLIQRAKSDYSIAYREVDRPDTEWFLAGYFALQSAASEAGRATIKQLLQKRSMTQPIGAYSCGSVFRNPPNDYAGRLIEACGLKGYRIGGAAVSEKHANFIVNDADATANDIEQLIQYIQQQVVDTYGVNLHPEVLVVGDKL